MNIITLCVNPIISLRNFYLSNIDILMHTALPIIIDYNNYNNVTVREREGEREGGGGGRELEGGREREREREECMRGVPKLTLDNPITALITSTLIILHRYIHQRRHIQIFAVVVAEYRNDIHDIHVQGHT